MDFDWRVGENANRGDRLAAAETAEPRWPPQQLSKVLSSAITTIVLKLATAVLGVQTIFILWDILAGNNQAVAFPLRYFILLAVAMGWVAFVISGGRRSHTRTDQPGLWQLFAWTVVARLFVLAWANLV